VRDAFYSGAGLDFRSDGFERAGEHVLKWGGFGTQPPPLFGMYLAIQISDRHADRAAEFA
jgi:hypothetical protein